MKIHIFNSEIIPFSWFRNIIISAEDYNTNREVIIEHERAHIQLKHNYDLLFINTLAIFQWFNPIFWLLRKELITIHEYQADNPERIRMMLKKRSSPKKAIKVLLLIPLLAIAVAAFAKTEFVVFPKSLTTEIPKYVAVRIAYPEEAKEAGTSGEFYVRIKSAMGEVKQAEVVDIKEYPNTPCCEPLIVVAYGKSTGKPAETESVKGLASIENELLRSAALLSLFDNPEWGNGNYDFILPVVFEFRKPKK